MVKGSTKNEKTTMEVKVTRAHEFEAGTIAFDMEVNGITIYGMYYRAGISPKTKEEYEIISFPSRKGKDGKYYNHVYFAITDEVKKSIIEQLGKLV